MTGGSMGLGIMDSAMAGHLGTGGREVFAMGRSDVPAAPFEAGVVARSAPESGLERAARGCGGPDATVPAGEVGGVPPRTRTATPADGSPR